MQKQRESRIQRAMQKHWLESRGVEASVMVNVRISELLHPDAQPSLQQLAAIQEIGNPQLPIDDYGDCNDVYQLVTMNKTLPQDKTQRIYISQSSRIKAFRKNQMDVLGSYRINGGRCFHKGQCIRYRCLSF